MDSLRRRWFRFGQTREPTPVTTAEVKRLYARPPAFTDLLPWMEYDPHSCTFLLEDGVSVGALLELTPVGSEARTPAFMAQYFLKQGSWRANARREPCHVPKVPSSLQSAAV